jgi:hypothetical protein
MRQSNLFPISLRCNDKGWSEHSFQNAFMRVRPKDKTWYGYDVEIMSPTDVVFIVYSMADATYGGLGKADYNLQATVSPDLTAPYIDRRIVELAAQRRTAELAAEEARIVEQYANELRAALSLAKSETPQ